MPVTSDISVSVYDVRQRFEKLEPTDVNYRQILLELLNHKELRPYIQGLQEPDLRGFVELLDGVRESGNDHSPV